MREIREVIFRGKRTDNGEWVCGDLLQDVESGICAIVSYVNLGGNIHDLSESCIFAVIPETVGQFTGLTDKNGVKIFEGDIVRYGTNTNRADNEEIYEVVFETRGGSGYFGIRISEIETWQFCLEVPAKLMEVIGNIHDNPELLGGENNGINR